MDETTLDISSTLVGKFYTFRPNVDLVQQWAFNVWKLKGNVLISAMTEVLFLFKFTIKEDMIKVLLEGLWFFNKGQRNGLSLCIWKPRFDPKMGLGRVSPTWVCLLELPLEYWNPDTLKSIVDSFGSLITSGKLLYKRPWQCGNEQASSLECYS
ncbi:hypothetical protein SUGI_1193180 [Cryptomeria japonica]|nr:hypothetical protein SUGI_1193180 [Cryptomeria japonica]